MRTRILCMLCMLAFLALSGCSARNIIEMKAEDPTALQNTGAYIVVPLEVTFQPPIAWEISPEDWRDWVDLWKVDFRNEMRTQCDKTLNFVDKKEDATGTVVTCTVYEMDKGGFSGFGGNGFARAHITVVDPDGRVIYDAKLEGTGANSGFESAVAEGRMKFAILNLARQIADVLENGK